AICLFNRRVRIIRNQPAEFLSGRIELPNVVKIADCELRIANLKSGLALPIEGLNTITAEPNACGQAIVLIIETARRNCLLGTLPHLYAMGRDKLAARGFLFQSERTMQHVVPAASD